jgi:predicted transcriptional regulator
MWPHSVIVVASMGHVGVEQTVLRVRLDPEDAALLRRIAEKSRLSKSDVVRAMIRAQKGKRRWKQTEMFR